MSLYRILPSYRTAESRRATLSFGALVDCRCRSAHFYGRPVVSAPFAGFLCTRFFSSIEISARTASHSK